MKNLLILITAFLCAACSHKTADQVSAADMVQLPPKVGNPAYALPKATAFRMSGDYSDNVAVTLNQDGSLAYYPAPSDLTLQSKPYDLGNGWWLNRQGLSANSVFTKWTFAEYMALPAVPSAEEIKAAIIPGAKVTAFEQLPVSASEALADPEACIKFVTK